MKKILLTCALLMVGSAITTLPVKADEPQKTTENTKCITTKGSTNGVVVGGSTQTCVTTYSDGRKTVRETTCGEVGVGGSVGVANGSAIYSDCTTTTTEYPAKSKSSNNTKRKKIGTYLGVGSKN